MNDTEYRRLLTSFSARNQSRRTDMREINGQDIRGTEKDVARAYNEHWFGDNDRCKPPHVDDRRPAQMAGCRA